MSTLSVLKPSALALTTYGPPGLKPEKLKLPESLAVEDLVLPVGTCSTVIVAPGTLTEPEIEEDVSLAAKEKPIKKTDKEINIFFIILLLLSV